MKLSNASLEALKNRADIITPSYDRASVKAGIMHMSIGGFHRSHQAVYMDNVLSSGDTQWGICAVGLMPQDKENIGALNAQDTLYNVLERSAAQDELKIIGSIIEVMHAPSAPQDVLARLSDTDIKILSITVTEKGYCYDNNQNLDLTNDLIRRDIQNLDSPKTVLGYIVAGLHARKQSGNAPFTVMSCDNLPGNGHLTRKLVLQFAAQIDGDLKQWIEGNVSFPNSMVDRITPVTTEEVSRLIQEKFDIDDKWPVFCEDYIQWVLERYEGDQPPFEQAGIQLVDEVDPFEKMKVRLLNGSHSALSYISYLMGYRAVDKAMSDPLISKFVRAYMDEITNTLDHVPGVDLEGYKAKLIERFSNPAISDQVQRLAQDGSQKIPNAILPCILHNLENGRPIKFLSLALAGWFKYLSAKDEQGHEIEIDDPLSAQLIPAAQEDDAPKALLNISETFGHDLAQNNNFIQALTADIQSLNTIGTKATLEEKLK